MGHLDPETVSFLNLVGGALLIIVAFCVGGFFVVVTIVACRNIAGASEHVSTPRCPWCEEKLRRLEVQSIDRPFPSEAWWICANYYCKEKGHLFGNKEGEPEPLPAKPDRIPEI